jgi:hypothetical protein
MSDICQTFVRHHSLTLYLQLINGFGIILFRGYKLVKSYISRMSVVSAFSIHNSYNQMTPTERSRQRLLTTLHAPSTCLVPRTDYEIPQTDRLLSTLHKHEDFLIGAWCISGILSTTGDICFTAATIGGEGPPTPIALGIIAILTGYLWVGSYCSLLLFGHNYNSNTFTKWVFNRRVNKIQRRELKRASKQATQLALASGWRPQEGIPHPSDRDDTHARWLIEAHATEVGIVVGLRQWNYSDTKFWQPQNELEQVMWFDDGDESIDPIGDYRAQLEAQIQSLESQAKLDFASEKAAKERALEGETTSVRVLAQHINDNSVAAI